MSKFHLIPDQMYQSILSNDKTIHDYSRELVEKTLNSKKLDASTKNRLYNIRLKNYLKHKKVEDERPLRVKLDAENTSLVPKIPIVQETAIEEEKEEKVPIIEKNLSTPMIPRPKIAKTPVIIRPMSDKDKQQIIVQLKGIIKKDRAKFNVTPANTVLNEKNKEVRGSNLDRILTYTQDMSIGQAPKGFNDLLPRLQNEKTTKELVDKLLRVNSPYRTRGKQRGAGKKIRINLWKF